MPLDKDRFKDLWGDLNNVLEDFIEMPVGEDDSGSDDASGRDEPTESGPRADESPLDQLQSAESKSKADIVLETGLTPMELLIELLGEYDGRMRQQQIVDATGWSEASVSRLLTKMEDQSNINRIQVGNEKVVFLPEYVPDAAKHPLQRYADEAQTRQEWGAKRS
ncbi:MULTISPECIES: helix-turn-helix domain-containing protein [unclassified Haladaptatus]|uniref:helix-turn-helix transcriptional regulator n=2 Tax=Haladaptatus TaxID=367188 RepID=UPI0023E7B336|nr:MULTISPECIES: helix-turn-helix domain-containing protein [unclassified Haladaptatus]